jgi:hypothetical protein
MKLNLARGTKIDALTAICFAAVTPINNFLRDEPIIVGSILTGSVFAFCVFGLIGTFTDKIGSEVGDA